MKKLLRHFYNTADYSQQEILGLIDTAIKMKKGSYKETLINRSLALLFFNPSLRTKASFVRAMEKLGGNPFVLDVKEGTYTFEFEDAIVMDKGTIEHVKEAARVLSRYYEGIAIRASDLITSNATSALVQDWQKTKTDLIIKKFMQYATVPVINMESNVYHPCQGLGDAMTIKEKLGTTTKKKYVLTWTYHPKALPMAVTNSQILGACDLGMDITVAHPHGWELDPEIIETMKKRASDAGGNILFSNNMKKALKGADIVVSKSWGALQYYGNWKKEKELRENLKHWIVNKNKMAATNNAYYLHCLPVRRNVEVTDDVIDSNNSLVTDQAENRMWAQMAILDYLLQYE